MINKSKYNSLSEWRKAKPKDYACAHNRGFIEKICKYYGWIYKTPNSIEIDETIRLDAINNLTNLLSLLETETENFYVKDRLISSTRSRKLLSEIKIVSIDFRNKLNV